MVVRVHPTQQLCVYGRVVEGSRLLICRGEIPIVGSIPTGHANKYN